MRKLHKILISLGAVGMLLSIPLFTHAAGPGEIIIPYGAIYVQHASYQTTYLATTTTETGRGNTLMSAYNNAVCGDTIMVASSTYNIGQGVLDLTKQGTCTTNALSLIGIGMPTIKGSNTSGTGIYEIVQPGDGSIVQNLIIRALQVFPSNFGFPIYIASDNATIVIRNVKAYGNTDGIYAFNGNTGVNLTIDNFTGTCHWDCGTFDMPFSTTTITDSSFNIVTPPVTSGVLRPLFFARGTYYLNNVSAIGFGGTSRISSIQIDATAGAQDSVTMYSGVLSANGAATSYEIDNQGSGSVNIFSGVSRTVASTSGAVLYPDNKSIRYSLGNNGASSTVLWNNNGIANWVATSSLGITGGGGSGVSGGTAGMLASWTGATTLTATSGPTFGWFVSTSTTDSEINGALMIGSTTPPSADLHINQRKAISVIDERSSVACGTYSLSNTGNARSIFNVDNITSSPSIELQRGATGCSQGSSLYFDWAYSNNADYDLRMQMSSASNLTISGTAIWDFENSGHVGVGTTSPFATLSVVGTTTSTVFYGNKLTYPTNDTLTVSGNDGHDVQFTAQAIAGSYGLNFPTPDHSGIFWNDRFDVYGDTNHTGSIGSAELHLDSVGDISILPNNAGFGSLAASRVQVGLGGTDGVTMTRQFQMPATAAAPLQYGVGDEWAYKTYTGGVDTANYISARGEGTNASTNSGDLVFYNPRLTWSPGSTMWLGTTTNAIFAIATTTAWATSTTIGGGYRSVAGIKDGLLVQSKIGIGTTSPGSALDVNGGFFVETASTTAFSYDFCTSNNTITYSASSTNAIVSFTNSNKCHGKSLIFLVTAQPNGLIGSTTFSAGSNSGNIVWDGGINPGNCVLAGCTDRFVFTSEATTSEYIGADLSGTF